jgi:hypothetical protein
VVVQSCVAYAFLASFRVCRGLRRGV